MFQNDSTKSNYYPMGSGLNGSSTSTTLNFPVAENKEQMLERLIKEGKISFKEALVLMDKTVDNFPFLPIPPYEPFIPVSPFVPYEPPFQPWTQPWTAPWGQTPWNPYTGPTVTYSTNSTAQV